MRVRARALLSVAAGSLALLGGAAVAPVPGMAAVAIIVSVSPSSGPVGSGAVVSFSVDPKQPCKYVGLAWDGTPLGTFDEANGSASITIPQSTLGGHKITAVNGCGIRGGTSFTVTERPQPTPTPTKSTPPNPTPPPTTAPPRPTPSDTDPSTPTTDPSDPADPTPSATPSVSTSPLPQAMPTPGGGQLVLDRDNVRPGEPLTATGSGCDPGAPVVLTSDTDQVGTATADSAGVFTAPVQFTRLEPGRRVVTATCGPVLTTHVDLIVSSSTSGQAGTVVVLIFFILVGIALLRWQYNTARS